MSMILNTPGVLVAQSMQEEGLKVEGVWVQVDLGREGEVEGAWVLADNGKVGGAGRLGRWDRFMRQCVSERGLMAPRLHHSP